MRILQLNIWGGRLSGAIAELIQKEKPDFLCMQEVVSVEGDVGLLFGTVEDLQEKIKYKSIHYSPVFNFRIMNRTALFGNCILSNYRFQKKETIFTNLEYIEDFSFEKHSYNIRNLQHVEIDVKGKKLHVLNHHGHHIKDHKNGDDATLRQMNQLGKYIDELDGAVILTGDFNLAPHSESIEQINKRLINLSIKNKLKTTRTAFTHKTEVCDYIFASEDVKAKSFRALDDLVSDHKALVLDFEL